MHIRANNAVSLRLAMRGHLRGQLDKGGSWGIDATAKLAGAVSKVLPNETIRWGVVQSHIAA